MAEQIALEVTRFSPERDKMPSVQSFDVPLRKEWVVLDALNYVKDKVDGSLSFRWSCRMGVCGSCGMVMGEIRRAQTDLRHLPDSTTTTLGPGARGATQEFSGDARPYRRDHGLPLEKLSKVKPLADPREERKRRAFGRWNSLQSPEQLETFRQYSMCINCLLCYAACPVYGLDPLFAGPAALALAQRYNMDSRDEGQSERLDILSQHDGIWGCTFVGDCTQVCPKHVDPAGAIQQYKLTATQEWVKSLLMPWGGK